MSQNLYPNKITKPPNGKTSLPGDEGVWFFIIADLCIFALFFLVFMDSRANSPQIYEHSRQLLDIKLGLINTCILLTSGMCMALAVHYARHQLRAKTLIMLSATFIIGLGFFFTKLVEYGVKIKSGITLTSNEFFTFYFAYTGIHFLHYLIGMVAILVLIKKTRNSTMDTRYCRWIEAAGCYWHMVDLLWLVLFPMLYLLRSTS